MTTTPGNKTLILVRHGQSDYNRAGRIQGTSDHSRLTDLGLQSAIEVGRALRDEPLDRVLSSPLQRARETAEGILSQRPSSPPIEVITDLKEVDVPLWQGMRHEDIRASDPVQFRRWMAEPHLLEMKVDTGVLYPARDLYHRAGNVLADILSAPGTQTILAVSHGGTVQALVNLALGLGAERHHTLQQSNCGLTRIDFDPLPGVRGSRILSMNDTTPLGEDWPKIKSQPCGLRLSLGVQAQDECGTPADSVMLRTAGRHFHRVFMEQDIGTSRPDDQDIAAEGFDSADAIARLATDFGARDSNALTDWLVLASDTTIRHILATTTGMGHSAAGRLELDPGRTTIVHLSGMLPRPVVQAINTRHYSRLYESDLGESDLGESELTRPNPPAQAWREESGIDAEHGRLEAIADKLSAAKQAVFTIPAPDMEALRTKLLMLIGAEEVWGEQTTEPVRRDCERLLGEAV